MAIRKVVVIDFGEDEEIVNTVGEKVPDLKVAIGEDLKVRPADADTPSPKAPENPTEAQIRARHRDAVVRTMAAVDRVLMNLPESRTLLRMVLKNHVGVNATTALTALEEYLDLACRYVVPDPLPKPVSRVNLMREVRIISGGFKGYVPLPLKVSAFLDRYETDPNSW